MDQSTPIESAFRTSGKFSLSIAGNSFRHLVREAVAFIWRVLDILNGVGQPREARLGMAASDLLMMRRPMVK